MTDHTSDHVKAAHSECRKALERLRKSIVTKTAELDAVTAEDDTDVEAVPVVIDPASEISEVNHRDDLRSSLSIVKDSASAILRRRVG